MATKKTTAKKTTTKKPQARKWYILANGEGTRWHNYKGVPKQLIEIDGETTSGAAEILLGLGVFAIDGKDVALCRGGGQFTVEREYRDINADGDKGSVKDRVVIDTERAKLKMNVLTMLTSLTTMYPALSETSATS